MPKKKETLRQQTHPIAGVGNYEDEDSDNDDASLQSDSSDEGGHENPNTGETIVEKFENDKCENPEEMNIDDEIDDAEETNNNQEDTEAEAPVVETIVENDNTDEICKTRSGKSSSSKGLFTSMKGRRHAESFAVIM